MGELDMYRQCGTTPNFSEVARRHGLDRHTVSKYWREGRDVGDGRSARGSGFDAFREEIEQRAQLPGVRKKAVHEWLLHRHGDGSVPGYGAFTEWTRENGIEFGAAAAGAEPHPRYETAPGEQLQFDWKEDLSMRDRSGREHRFSVFSATLGYSRLHRFRVSPSRTADDALLCLLSCMVANGGTTEVCLTDNMPALVTVSGGRRRVGALAERFAKEAGFRFEFCRPRTPQTKGKDESANRFLSRLAAYEGEFDGEEGLAEAVARIEARSNSEPCESTGVPPAVLFARHERERLRPLGDPAALEAMLGRVSHQVVPATMLVRFGGREWSVPRRCIGRRVKLLAGGDGTLRVFLGADVVAVHDTSRGGAVNYDPAHYAEALSCKARFADADIDEAARANLELLGRLGEAGL